jgi:hypothetical protein
MRQNSFDDSSLVTARHPLYSPDITPSDFWPLGQIKTSFAGRIFNNSDECFEAVIEFLTGIQPSEL